jgi:hypothetical protein
VPVQAWAQVLVQAWAQVLVQTWAQVLALKQQASECKNHKSHLPSQAVQGVPELQKEPVQTVQTLVAKIWVQTRELVD